MVVVDRRGVEFVFLVVIEVRFGLVFFLNLGL